MKGLWLEDRKLRLKDDLPRPRTPPNEALIRVLQAGICNTDLEMLEGYYPFTGVLGHEFVGVVEEGPDKLVGQRVVGEINTWCGDCPSCRRGLTTHCVNRTVLGLVGRQGAFAEYLTLPLENLHLVPDKLSTDVATFIEPLAAALQILNQIEIGPEDRVLVLGDGKLGLLVAQVLSLLDCQLEVGSRRQRHARILAARGIASCRSDQLPPAGFDIAIDCTGSPQGLARALEALRPGGTLVMKSSYAGAMSFDASAVVVREITLIGSRCGPFAPALHLLANDSVDVTSLIEGRYPLDRGLAALEHAAQPGVLKILLTVSANPQ